MPLGRASDNPYPGAHVAERQHAVLLVGYEVAASHWKTDTYGMLPFGNAISFSAPFSVSAANGRQWQPARWKAIHD